MGAPFVVLTGASGSGKTAIAEAIEVAYPRYAVFRFDTIGVPSADEMATFGSGHQPGGAWQRTMTLQWFERIAPMLNSGRPVLFEGQMRIAFMQEALAAQKIPHAHVVLMDCDDATRISRLTHQRKQPELANESMLGWARYLRQEAQDTGYEIFDTTSLSLAESVTHIVSYLSERSNK